MRKVVVPARCGRIVGSIVNLTIRELHIPRKFSYLTLDLAYLPVRINETDLLNDAGEQGWELIAIMSNDVAYLRRQPPATWPRGAKERVEAFAGANMQPLAWEL